MFQQDDLIVYGSTGICRVDAIGQPEQAHLADKDRLYYTLIPLYSSGMIYTPVDTTVFMRPIISAEEAHRLIDSIPNLDVQAYHNSSTPLLRDHYLRAIQTHDCAELIKLTMSIFSKRKDIALKGKKMGQVDEQFLKRAQDLLFCEFAAALNIPREDVSEYITARVAVLAQE
ncbi:MAG: CarD family transcriptional regulator [Angelakisella sp.]